MSRSGSPVRPGLREVFTRPGYRRLWAARTVSQWGDVVNTVALSLLIYRLTGSGLGVTGVVIAEIVPVLLLAPLAGPLIDRSDPVTVMVAADLVRAGLIGVLAVQHHRSAVVYAVAFGMSVGTTFFNPSAGAVLPTLVTEDGLVAANGGIWTAAVLSQIGLAPLAGILVATGGYTAAFTINAGSFVLSAVTLIRLPRGRGRGPSLGQRHLLAQAREGIAVISGDPVLRGLAAGQLLAALSAGATSALLVILARQHLHLAASGYGLLLGAVGAGAASGPLLLLRFIRRPQRPLFVFGPYAVRGLVDLVLAVTTALPVAVLALVFYGLGTSTGAVTFTALLQARAPEQARGRVFAGMDVLWQTGRLLSLAVGAVLADAVGIPAVYLLGGSLLLLASLTGLLTGLLTGRLTGRPARAAPASARRLG